MAIIWTQKQDVGPSARWRHGMAFDAVRQRVLSFGGEAADGLLGDTWLWDGQYWTQVADFGPSPRAGVAMASDLTRQRIVLFGGRTAAGLAADTWEWDGASWTQVADLGPDPRAGHALAYDERRRRTLLFGGESGSQPDLSDTWGWDGNEWTQLGDTGPSGRRGHGLAYDSTRQLVVLHGGLTAAGGDSGTWAWNGSAWTQAADIGPGPVYGGAIAFNGVGVELFSGVTGGVPGPRVPAATWEWDGRLWTESQDMGPAGRQGAALAADPVRGAMVLFGGNANLDDAPAALLGDTWEHPATILGGDRPADSAVLESFEILPRTVAFNGIDTAQIVVTLAAPSGSGGLSVSVSQIGPSPFPGGPLPSIAILPGQRQGALQIGPFTGPGEFGLSASVGGVTLQAFITMA